MNKDNIDFIELSIKSVSWNSVEKPLLDFAFLSKVPTKKRATFERNMDQMPFFLCKMDSRYLCTLLELAQKLTKQRLLYI